MKNSSIAALALGLTSLFSISPTVLAQTATPSVRPVARCEFLPNAPDQHVVVKGDTLWGISGMFLKHAWCWPQVWGLNRAQIRDPHWIYPGQIVYFDRIHGRLSLSKGGNGNGGDASLMLLHPQVRLEAIGLAVTPAISAAVIGPFLSQPLVIENNALESDPRIVAGAPGSINFGRGNRVYVRGAMDEKNLNYQIFRQGQALKDPDTQKILGYEAVYLGSARVVDPATPPSDVVTMQITGSKEEISVGDRLLPVEPSPLLNFVPHAPADKVNARILTIYGGVTSAGQNQIVSLNAGREEGMDPGTVLDLYRDGGEIKDSTAHDEKVRLPDEQYGTLMVFRVFDHISYGLIMQVRDVATVGDYLRSPN